MNRLHKFATASAACLLSTATLADIPNGYGVATSATAGDYTAFINVVSAYRMRQDSSFNYSTPSDTPPVQSNGCNFINPNPDFVCAGAPTGTASTGYNLTASSSSASLQTARLSQPAYLGQSSGSTYADLAAGKLGGSSQADWARGATTYASFSDRLTFNIAGAGPATVTQITVSLAIDGALTLFNASLATARVYSDLRFGTAFATLNYGSSAVNFSIQDGWVSGGWESSGPGVSVFTGTYALVGATPTLDLRTYLVTEAAWGASSNYANTAAFQMSLPDGVSYSSASGVFLSAAPVPEPGTWALMLAGVSALLVKGRRRA